MCGLFCAWITQLLGTLKGTLQVIFKSTRPSLQLVSAFTHSDKMWMIFQNVILLASYVLLVFPGQYQRNFQHCCVFYQIEKKEKRHKERTKDDSDVATGLNYSVASFSSSSKSLCNLEVGNTRIRRPLKTIAALNGLKQADRHPYLNPKGKPWQNHLQ